MLSTHSARADSTTGDSSDANTSATSTAPKKKKKKKKKKRAALYQKSDESRDTRESTETNPLAQTDTQNTRMKSYVGSASRWSGHLNFTYTGPAVNDPFGSHAPNPLNQVPVPLVLLQGQVSVHYRLDTDTTLAFGTGVQVYTPTTNPTGWSVADPYFNYDRMVTTGPIHNFVQLGATLWTDNQYYTQDGYFFGINFNDQSYYVFKNGITVGMNFWASVNAVTSAPQYDPGQQDIWYIGGGPYVEYAINDQWSVRSVLGVQGDHTNATPGRAIVWENPYQTVGVGVQIIKAWYLYTYLIASPYSGNFTANNTGLGFNAIINLF